MDKIFYYVKKTIFSMLFVLWAILSYDPTDKLFTIWEVPSIVNAISTILLVIAGPLVIFDQKPTKEKEDE